MSGIRASGPLLLAYRLLILTVALLVLPGRASAQGVSLIRDTEIENTIRVYTAPLFRAAGIEMPAGPETAVAAAPYERFTSTTARGVRK